MATSETIDIPNYLIGNNAKLFAKKNITSGQTNAIRINPPKIAYIASNGIVLARYGIFAFLINTDSNGNVNSVYIENLLSYPDANPYTADFTNDTITFRGTAGTYDNFLVLLNTQTAGVSINDFTVDMIAQ